MVNLQLRKLYNHEYETNGEYSNYFSEKIRIVSDAILSTLTQNMFLNYCITRGIVRLNDLSYRYTNYKDFRFDDLIEIIDEFIKQKNLFFRGKQKIYKKELEIRKKNDKVQLFGKKYKLCNDICNVIISFL